MAVDQRFSRDVLKHVTALHIHPDTHTHTPADVQLNQPLLNMALLHICQHAGPRFLLLAQCSPTDSTKEQSYNQ